MMTRFYFSTKLKTLPEGLGRVLLEAQAMKKVVVAYDVGGVPEAMIQEQRGHLVRRGNSRGLAMHIKGLLKNEDMRRGMGERCRQHVVERFSLDALAARHEALYAEAADFSRSAARQAQTDTTR